MYLKIKTTLKVLAFMWICGGVFWVLWTCFNPSQFYRLYKLAIWLLIFFLHVSLFFLPNMMSKHIKQQFRYLYKSSHWNHGVDVLYWDTYFLVSDVVFSTEADLAVSLKCKYIIFTEYVCYFYTMAKDL